VRHRPDQQAPGIQPLSQTSISQRPFGTLLPTLEDATSVASGLIGKAAWAFERILGAALPCAESADFVRAMEERWKAQI